MPRPVRTMQRPVPEDSFRKTDGWGGKLLPGRASLHASRARRPPWISLKQLPRRSPFHDLVCLRQIILLRAPDYLQRFRRGGAVSPPILAPFMPHQAEETRPSPQTPRRGSARSRPEPVAPDACPTHRSSRLTTCSPPGLSQPPTRHHAAPFLPGRAFHSQQSAPI